MPMVFSPRESLVSRDSPGMQRHIAALLEAKRAERWDRSIDDYRLNTIAWLEESKPGSRMERFAGAWRLGIEPPPESLRFIATFSLEKANEETREGEKPFAAVKCHRPPGFRRRRCFLRW